MASELVIPEGEGRWIVEKDMAFGEDGLRRYYATHYAPGRPSPRLWGLASAGFDDIYDVERKLNLTYCISNDFADKPLLVKRMQEAAMEWERITDVNFTYRPQFDATCTQGSDDAYFAVVPVADHDDVCASAFGPSDTPPISRRLTITPHGFASSNCGYTSGQLLRHELGHVLGFQHEFLRPNCAGGDNLPITANFLSEEDNRSIMGYTTKCGALERPSRRDVAGAKFVYSLPKNHWLGRVAGSEIYHDGRFDLNNFADILWYSPLAGTDEVLARGGVGGMTLSSVPTVSGARHKPLVGRFSSDALSDVLFYSDRNNQDRILVATSPMLGFTSTDLMIDGAQQPILGHFSTTSPTNGRTDVFMYGPGPEADFVLRANGVGSVFTTVPAPNIGTASDYYLPIPGDFDRDGDTDIFFYNSDSLAPSKYLKTTGNVTFTIDEIDHDDIGLDGDVNSEFYYTWVTGDFDDDGRHDIFWYSPEPGQSDVVWYGKSIGLPFTGAFTLNQTSSDTFKLFTGDFDGNGSTDILWYNQNDGLDANPHMDQVWLMHPNFGTTRTTFTLDIGLPDYNLHVGDYNGDGLSDFYVWDPNGTDRVWKSDGDGTFTILQSLTGPVGYPVGYGQG